MSKDLIQALEDAASSLNYIANTACKRDEELMSEAINVRGYARSRANAAEEALSRHRSSVESVELPEPEARVELWPDDSVRLAIVPNGPISENEVYYTATTVRILIAAAVEREREECAVMFDRRGWVSADQIAAAIRSRGEMK